LFVGGGVATEHEVDGCGLTEEGGFGGVGEGVAGVFGGTGPFSRGVREEGGGEQEGKCGEKEAGFYAGLR
jgi:hypothetical protein